MIFNFTEGTYNLSLFSIYLDTDLPLDNLANLPPEQLVVFYHEYFHFLQDVTSSFTFNVMWSIYGSNAQLIQHAQQQSKELKLPLRHLPTLRHLDAERKLLKLIFGDQTCMMEGSPAQGEMKVVGACYVKRSDFPEVPNSENIQFVELQVQDATGYTGKYSFGAVAVIETMTYLIQRKFFGSSPVSDMPYLVATRLAEYYCPGIGSNDEYVFAVCDLSMQTQFPGWTFFMLLERLQQGMPQPASAEDIYGFCLPILEEMWFWQESFDDYKTRVIGTLSQLNGHPAFKANLQWILAVLENGWKVRRDDPMIMLRLYHQAKPFNDLLFSLRQQLGMPELVNRTRQRWFWPPASLEGLEQSIEPIMLAGIIQLQDTLLDGKSCCSLHEYCTKSPGRMPVDEKCTTAPWEKTYGDSTCPFGAAWNSFGLDKLNIVSPDWELEEIEFLLDTDTLYQLNLKGYPKNTWVPAPIGDYIVRVDPAGEQGQVHVHIARPEHRNAKRKQVSWNIDGTRHDAGTFNENFEGMQQARKNARKVLGLPKDFVLQYRLHLGDSLPYKEVGELSGEVIRYVLSAEEYSTGIAAKNEAN